MAGMILGLFVLSHAIFSFSVAVFFLKDTNNEDHLLSNYILETPTTTATATLESSEDKKPLSSSDNQYITRKYFKYDEAGPRAIPGTARSHGLPNAIPITRIIPREQAENKTFHIHQRSNTSHPKSIIELHRPTLRRKGIDESMAGRYNWNHTHETDYRTLYLYNPSILPLHNTLPTFEKDDPDVLSADELQQLTGGDPTVRYVAVFRAYTGCNCFGPNKTDRTLMTAGEQINYLAVALLDEGLDLIAGTDVLIDLNAGPGRLKYFRQGIEDCRISLIKGAIYFLCKEELKQVAIKRKKQHLPKYSVKHHPPGYTPPGYNTNGGIKLSYVYPNINGNGLEVTLLSHCKKIGSGKNFNIFRTKSNSSSSSPIIGDSDSSYDYYLQEHPIPHTYNRLNIPDGTKSSTGTALNNVLKRRPEWLDKQQDIVPQETLPQPTFDTPDTVHSISHCEDGSMNCTQPIDVPFFGENDHGTACCVRVHLPTNNNKSRPKKEVMVGISHQKLSRQSAYWLKDVKKRYEHFGIDQFVSQFVAYEVTHPFHIVARSGWFCLGFANENEFEEGTGSTFAGKNTGARLDIFNDTYNCPMIHFASGFSEVVGNYSRAIIGYGVNDCHPRMFFVDKEEIVRMLTTG